MASESIEDSLIRHQIFLQGLATHEAKTFNPFLVKADKIIRDVLSSAGPTIDTQKELNNILSQLREELSVNYSEWGQELVNDLEEITENEINFTATSLDRATDGVEVLKPTPSQTWAAINVRPIQVNDKGESKLMQPLIKGFTPTEVQRINGTIRNGFFSGATTQEMITAIRGTKKNKFNDGVLITTQRNAETIARTSVNHVSNIARQSTYKANQDIITGWLFSATLDMRTSSTCRFHDQEVYKIGEGPLPPLHLNCRSSSIPQIKDKFDIFGTDTTRASKGAKGGQQTNAKTYYEWLGRQPKTFQQEVLGKAQTELFRKGGLTNEEFRKLTSNKFGQALTLDEIKAKDATAWGNAGLDE